MCYFFQQRALKAEVTVAKLKEEVNILKVHTFKSTIT